MSDAWWLGAVIFAIAAWHRCMTDGETLGRALVTTVLWAIFWPIAAGVLVARLGGGRES